MTGTPTQAGPAVGPTDPGGPAPSQVRSGPASLAQQRLWFLYRLQPEALVYQASATFQIDGDLHVEALRQAVRAVVERHEILRTLIVADAEGDPVQLVTATNLVTMPIEDVTGLREPDRDDRVRRFLAPVTQRPFALEREPPFRAALVRLAPTRHLFVVACHHIAFDGWSWGILLRDLQRLYEAALGEPTRLPPLALQHVDFARRQQETATGESWAEQLRYWRRQLDGAPRVINLPLDRTRPAESSHRGSKVEVHLLESLATEVRRFGSRPRVTTFMILLTVFQALMHRYSGDRTVVVGTPVAGRDDVALEQLIGFFVGTVALRADFTEDVSFRELLLATRRAVLEATSRLDVPFDVVVQNLGLDPQLSHHPVFQTLFQLDDGRLPGLELPGVTCTYLAAEQDTCGWDLHLSLAEQPDGSIRGWLAYATDLFDRDTAARFARDYVTLLRSLVAEPDQPMLAVSLAPAREIAHIVDRWGDGGRVKGPDQRLPERVDSVAVATPDAVAVEHDGARVTFDELARRSNQLAHHLRARGVGSETVVGVLLAPGINAVAATLAVHRAGGVVLGLDPREAPSRLGAVLVDSATALVVTTSRWAERVGHLPLVLLDEQHGELVQLPETAVDRRDVAAEAACLVYPGPSSGRPLGVVVTHRGIAGHLADAARSARLGPADRCLQVMPHGSTGWFGDLVESLSVGATLVVGGDLLDSPPARFVQRCAQLRPTALRLPVSYWSDLVDAGAAAELAGRLRWISIGGGHVTPDRIHRWRREVGNRVRLRVLYDPPEYGTFCAAAEVTDAWPAVGSVPIGRPANNTRLYVLGRTGQPVGIGEVGELYIAGDGMPRGYLGQPALTATTFVANPSGGLPGQRLFRSNDLARWRADGALMVVRPEIPPAPPVRQTGPTPTSAVPAEDLDVPPTVDPEREAVVRLAPRDEMERRLAELYRELLGVDEIGIREDFFKLGGHSLLAARLVNRIERRLGVSLPVSALFPTATVERLAAQIRDHDRRPDSVVVRLREGHGGHIVLVHPVGGEVLPYSTLARTIPGPATVHGIRSPLLDGDAEALADLESLAADYLSRLRAQGVHRPACYGGWSMGGVIALEMALQAHERDVRHPPVLAIDSALAAPGSPDFVLDEEALAVAFAQDVCRSTGLRPPAAGEGEDPLAALHATLVEAGRLAAAEGRRWVDRRFQVFSAHLRLLTRYRPRPYPGRVVLVLSGDRDDNREETLSAWRLVAAGGLEVRKLPADHYSILGPAHVAALAAAVPSEEVSGHD
ncbi:AMP-binding protein [Micromonospora orduensis]|uniref:AMP-binding protein n=1 Tax=Micromonospora orduensis TaxID=1420891 RepID=A0A5C4QU68_9ACTN|nr:condensation domain-containing protein [Micromonospora orduensis]TNH29623.1 AMP-binding protein [Micromonospora orduensis]